MPVFRLQQIFGDAPAVFRGMTFADHAPLLYGLTDDSPVIAVGVWAGDQPVGFGLARSGGAGDAGEVISIFVQPALWRRGLGTALMEALEQALHRRGCRTATVRYSTGPCSDVFERILAKRGWTPPQPQMLLARIRSEISQERWVSQSRLDPSFEVFPWAGLSDTDKAALESVHDTIPSALWPFESDAPLEPSCSIGIRCRGEIAGWMIVHRVAPDAVRFTALYVREPWRRAEVTFALLAESIRRKQRALGPGVVASLAVLIENRPMLRVLERKFYRYARHWQEQRGSAKVLT